MSIRELAHEAATLAIEGGEAEARFTSAGVRLASDAVCPAPATKYSLMKSKPKDAPH